MATEYLDHFGLRMSQADLNKLDALQAQMSATLGTRLSRSAVLRALLQRAHVGLVPVLEVGTDEA